MAELEPKQIQKELESGQVWPVYWIYGAEKMKARELVRRIRKTVLGDGAEAASNWNEENLDGSEVDAYGVVDAAQSLSLGGGTRLIIVRDAHALKEVEVLETLLGPKQPCAETASVSIFLSKDLDRRRKFSKRLLESAAVVACEEVREDERPAWIQYLAKRRGTLVPANELESLRWLDPWSLDRVEQELEKLELAEAAGVSSADLGEASQQLLTEEFLQAFFQRERARSLELAAHFADRPDESLPLLGLFAWNLRHLISATHDREKGTRSLKVAPFMAERFQRWAKSWSQKEIERVQSRLAEVDFSLKQTPRLPKGLWASLVQSSL